MIEYTPYKPSTGSSLPQKQGSKSPFQPLDIEKGALKLKNLMVSESMTTAVDLPKSLQQQELSGRPLIQDQRQARLVSEAQLCQVMLVAVKD